MDHGTSFFGCRLLQICNAINAPNYGFRPWIAKKIITNSYGTGNSGCDVSYIAFVEYF